MQQQAGKKAGFRTRELISILLFLADKTLATSKSSRHRGTGFNPEWLNMPQFMSWLYDTQHGKLNVCIISSFTNNKKYVFIDYFLYHQLLCNTCNMIKNTKCDCRMSGYLANVIINVLSKGCFVDCAGSTSLRLRKVPQRGLLLRSGLFHIEKTMQSGTSPQSTTRRASDARHLLHLVISESNSRSYIIII